MAIKPSLVIFLSLIAFQSSGEMTLTSSHDQVEAAENHWNNVISDNLSDGARDYLAFCSMAIRNKEDSFHRWDGPEFTAERKHIHELILAAYFAEHEDAFDPNDPDMYVVAGIGGSGKSSLLLSLLNEPVIPNDPDYFKEQLAKYDPSPFPKWPLLHADYLHLESTFLGDIALDRAIKGRYNIAAERTISQLSLLESLLNRSKTSGYDIHLLSAQLYPHIAMERVAQRFLVDPAGRYVPLSLIRRNAHEIQENIRKHRVLFDTHKILNTSDWQNVTSLFESGNVSDNFRDPQPTTER